MAVIFGHDCLQDIPLSFHVIQLSSTYHFKNGRRAELSLFPFLQMIKERFRMPDQFNVSEPRVDIGCTYFLFFFFLHLFSIHNVVLNTQQAADNLHARIRDKEKEVKLVSFGENLCILSISSSKLEDTSYSLNHLEMGSVLSHFLDSSSSPSHCQ